MCNRLKQQMSKLKTGLAQCIDEVEETREEMFMAAKKLVELSKKL